MSSGWLEERGMSLLKKIHLGSLLSKYAFYSITRFKIAGFYAYFFLKKKSEWKPIYGQHCLQKIVKRTVLGFGPQIEPQPPR